MILHEKLEAGQLDQEEGSMEEAVRVKVVKWFAGRLKMKTLKCNRSETSSSNYIRRLEK